MSEINYKSDTAEHNSYERRRSMRRTITDTINTEKVRRALDTINHNKKFTGGADSKNFILRFCIAALAEVLIWFVVLMMFFALIIYAMSLTPNKTFLGCSCYAISDECLEPMYNIGDCVIAGVIDASEIEVGDFITFFDEETYTAGIVDSTLDHYNDINARFFRVKDAYNNTYVVEPKNIIGREIGKIDGFGYIVNLLGGKTLYR